MVLGTQDLHKELEEKISRFHEREDTILYACCFDANAGLFEALMTPDDAILSDELNHASIIDGIRLSKAKKFRYKNKDMKGGIWCDLSDYGIGGKICFYAWLDRKSTRLNSSHVRTSRMPSSA